MSGFTQTNGNAVDAYKPLCEGSTVRVSSHDAHTKATHNSCELSRSPVVMLNMQPVQPRILYVDK